MDCSNNIGDAEECSSNESGWTMYIASPADEDNPDGGDDAGDSHGSGSSERKEYNKFVHGEDGGSDDSMASDASSGPSHQGTFKKSHDKGNRRISGDKRSERKGGDRKPKAGTEEEEEEEEHGGKVRSSRTSADVSSKGKSRKNK